MWINVRLLSMGAPSDRRAIDIDAGTDCISIPCIRGIDVDRRQLSHSDWPSIAVDSVSHPTNWDASILSSVVSTVSGGGVWKGC